MLKNTAACLLVLLGLSFFNGASAKMTEHSVNLPQSIGGWTQSGTSRYIDSKNIFEYMNGAGELYLAYRFDYLEVFEYVSADKESIVVEVYYMASSDDAFGLLSLDWTGEASSISDDTVENNHSNLAPTTRAFYGSGLLRLASGAIYSRILAYQESAESREAVLALGRAVAINKKSPPEPAFITNLPKQVGSIWKLRVDRIGFFRSHLVLNSLYYLSHENILKFSHHTEAVTAPYESVSDSNRPGRVQLLLVNYRLSSRAREALDSFHQSYLNEHKKQFDSKTESHIATYEIEDGWVGYRLDRSCLAVVFQCQDQKSAEQFLNQISCITTN